jgi:hypothetical protein
VCKNTGIVTDMEINAAQPLEIVSTRAKLSESGTLLINRGNN